MEKRERYVVMSKIVRELEDLRNSQIAVTKKIGQIEAENINLSSQTLSSSLGEIFENVDANLKRVEELYQKFAEETENYKSANSISEDYPDGP